MVSSAPMITRRTHLRQYLEIGLPILLAYGDLLQVGVSGFQHRREASGFHLPPFFGAGLFEAPMQADLLQGLFASSFFLSRRRALSTGSPFLSLTSLINDSGRS